MAPARRPFLPAVRRAAIRRLDIYEVSEAELDQIERGSLDSLFLNFSLPLLSCGISITATLLSSSVSSIHAFTVLVVVTVVSFVGGVVLLALWWKSRQSSRQIFAQIRRRMQPDTAWTTEPPDDRQPGE